MKYTINLTISGEVREHIEKLHKLTGKPRKEVKKWLAKQALWQVHIPVPKRVDQATFHSPGSKSAASVGRALHAS